MEKFPRYLQFEIDEAMHGAVVAELLECHEILMGFGSETEATTRLLPLGAHKRYLSMTKVEHEFTDRPGLLCFTYKSAHEAHDETGSTFEKRLLTGEPVCVQLDGMSATERMDVVELQKICDIVKTALVGQLEKPWLQSIS